MVAGGLIQGFGLTVFPRIKKVLFLEFLCRDVSYVVDGYEVGVGVVDGLDFVGEFGVYRLWCSLFFYGGVL